MPIRKRYTRKRRVGRPKKRVGGRRRVYKTYTRRRRYGGASRPLPPLPRRPLPAIPVRRPLPALPSNGSIIRSAISNVISNPTKDNLMTNLGRVNSQLRTTHGVSNWLASRNHNRLASVAKFFGYGRPRRYHKRVGGRRRRTTRRTMRRGRGFFGDMFSGIKSVLSPVVAPALGVAQQMAGQMLQKKLFGGRKRRTTRKIARRGGWYTTALKALGLGRKRRVHRRVHRRGGQALRGIYGYGRKRRVYHKRRVHRGGMIAPLAYRSAPPYMFGVGRKRRTHTRRGRGGLGGLLGSMLLPF